MWLCVWVCVCVDSFVTMAIGDLRFIGSLACLKGESNYKRIRVKIKDSKVHVVHSCL